MDIHKSKEEIVGEFRRDFLKHRDILRHLERRAAEGLSRNIDPKTEESKTSVLDREITEGGVK